MKESTREIIENHQRKIIPVVGQYIKNKKILDAGCGTGINSYFFNQNYNSEITLLDREDVREDEAMAFPFVKSSANKLPFENKSFDVAFLQYVLHHLSPEVTADEVLKELSRVSDIVIVVEEIFTSKTNGEKARAFDAKMNKILHPTSEMPIYTYYTDEKIKESFSTAGIKLIEEKVIEEGNEDDGYLQRKIYVLKS